MKPSVVVPSAESAEPTIRPLSLMPWPLIVRPPGAGGRRLKWPPRSEEHTSELQSLMRMSYAVFCLKNKNSKEHSYYLKHTLHIAYTANYSPHTHTLQSESDTM